MKEISFEETIKRFKENLKLFENVDLKNLSQDQLVELICTGCPFFDYDKERLECGAFRILAFLLKEGILEKEVLKKAYE
jgi:predicted aconitase